MWLILLHPVFLYFFLKEMESLDPPPPKIKIGEYGKSGLMTCRCLIGSVLYSQNRKVVLCFIERILRHGIFSALRTQPTPDFSRYCTVDLNFFQIFALGANDIVSGYDTP
jgi:hypothetical protein